MPRTHADGVARFDWIPADLSESMTLGVLSDRFHSARTPSNRAGATSRRWSDSPAR